MSVKKVISKFYGSCTTLVEVLNSEYENGMAKLNSHDESFRAIEFTCTSSYEEADSLLLAGYIEGAKKIQSECVRISQKPEVRALRFTRAVAGGLPIVPAYLSNNPRCMFSPTRVLTQSSVVKVNINCIFGSKTSARQVSEAGAKIITAVREIEKRGIRVELNTGCIGAVYRHIKSGVPYGDKNIYSMFICVKKASSPLNVLRIAYPIMHTSFLRRHYFRFLESLPSSMLDPKYMNDLLCVCSVDDLPTQYKMDGVYINLRSVIDSAFSVQDIIDIILKQK